MTISRDIAATVGTERDPVVLTTDHGTIDETEATPLVEERSRDGAADDRKEWSGDEEFAGLSWWRTPSVYWLLGPFFLFTLAFGGVIVPKLNLTVDLICRKHLASQQLEDPDFSYIPVIIGADNPQCYVPSIKSRASMFTMAVNLTTGLLSAFTAPRLGQLSDRYGRVKFLAIASCGGCLSEVVTILCAKYPDVLHYNFLIMGAIFDGIAGSFTTGTILTNSYTSDCTPPSKRAVSIGYIHACLFGGLAFGPLLASFFIQATGSNLSIFYITLGCHVFFVLFIGLVVPESLSKKRQEKARRKHGEEVEAIASRSGTVGVAASAANAFAPLQALVPRGPGTSPALRRNLVALATIDMILLGSAMSAGSVIILYCESPETWNWGTVESSRYVSAVSMVRVVVLAAILPSIVYFFRLRPARRRARETGVPVKDANAGADGLDIVLLRIALISDVTGALGYLLARREAVFVASGLLTALGGLGSATIQAAVTKHAPPEQVGKLLGAIGLLHAISRVCGPIAFSSLYAATVGKFDQAIFVLLAALFVIALCASMFVKPHVYLAEPEETSNEQEPLLRAQRQNGEAAASPALRE